VVAGVGLATAGAGVVVAAALHFISGSAMCGYFTDLLESVWRSFDGAFEFKLLV
jgi:hypothetical protein